MDTVQQVEAQLIMRHYEGFLKKGRVRGRRRSWVIAAGALPGPGPRLGGETHLKSLGFKSEISDLKLDRRDFRVRGNNESAGFDFLGGPGSRERNASTGSRQDFGIPQISTGDLLRDAVKRETPLGLAAKAKMEAGELVPDEVVSASWRSGSTSRIARKGSSWTVFPRTIAQAEYAMGFSRRRRRGNPLVIDIEVSEDLLLKRLPAGGLARFAERFTTSTSIRRKVDECCDKDGGKLAASGG